MNSKFLAIVSILITCSILIGVITFVVINSSKQANVSTEPTFFTAEDGTNGVNGLNGSDGISGVNGVNGVNGIDGKVGMQGVQGIQGIQGEKGEKGDTGEALPLRVIAGGEYKPGSIYTDPNWGMLFRANEGTTPFSWKDSADSNLMTLDKQGAGQTARLSISSIAAKTLGVDMVGAKQIFTDTLKATGNVTATGDVTAIGNIRSPKVYVDKLCINGGWCLCKNPNSPNMGICAEDTGAYNRDI